MSPAKRTPQKSSVETNGDQPSDPTVRAVLNAVEDQRSTIEDVIRFVHAHPELGHEEHECSNFLAGQLEEAGYELERGIAGMPTAFRALLRGRPGGRSIGIVDLYDAVPAVGEAGSVTPVHSCGHGPLAGGVAGAALALAEHRESLQGSVEIIGCPADELHSPKTRSLGGGKQLTAEAGVWDHLDAALYAHPEFNDTVTARSRTMRQLMVITDASRKMDASIELPRQIAATILAVAEEYRSDQLMIESMGIDGDVEEGSGMAIRADLLLTTDSEADLDALETELRGRIQGVAWSTTRTVPELVPDEETRAAVARAFANVGRDFLADPPPLPFATDFSAISRRVPAALIGIGRAGGWSFHTDDGAREFATSDGTEAAVATASVLALSVVELLEAT